MFVCLFEWLVSKGCHREMAQPWKTGLTLYTLGQLQTKHTFKKTAIKELGCRMKTFQMMGETTKSDRQITSKLQKRPNVSIEILSMSEIVLYILLQS